MLNPCGHPGSNYQQLKFMPKMFLFFPMTIFALPLVLNSSSKVQFRDKISTLTFSSLVDVLTRSWTSDIVFKIRIWASTLLVLLYFVSYLIRSPRFIPSLHFILGPQSAFYTRFAGRLSYLLRVLYPVRSLGAQSAVHVLYPVCILYSALSPRSIPGSQSAFYTYSAFYTRSAVWVRSPQSAFYTDW